ncbi:transferrin [Culicoides brevitarsis]|uniref:transferrin n=1 Tax=Culicoides brevitarsis TaxID=469753 RepID=UPI00307C64E6
MNLQLIFISILILNVHSRNLHKREIDEKVRFCVPRKYIADCLKLYANDPSDKRVSCIPARDQMECLEYVKKREADVMLADPEDMYIAYHLENDDFDIVQEIRTIEESHSAFRYDGIILVKKGSDIHSLKDLKGKRSCHTGFGRNVGYKIPLTKLRKNGVLKLSNDPELSSTEKELDALSLFFEKACIAGQWSPDRLVNEVFKKRYSNLCALCEDPAKCDYPDKYSGYDGAVRCVVEGQGDVAFTKTYFVKKHFNIPIVAGQVGSISSDAENYEYMCEDGRRTPITDQNPCSWAQRPWQAYMSNADIVSRKPIIQGYLSEFFEKGKTRLTKDEAAHLFIKDTLTTFNNSEVVRPHAHLFNAHYKDVIERDGTEQGVIRFCVSSEVEMRKCKWLKQAAYSRDIRPQLECVEKGREACLEAVSNGKAEVVVVPPSLSKQADEKNLLQVLSEKFDDDYFVALVDTDFGESDVPSSSLKFDSSQVRAVTSALYLNSKRGISKCPNVLSSEELAKIQIVNSKKLDEYKSANKQLLCQDWSKKTLSDYKTCNFDYSLPNGIYVNKAESRQTRDNIRHAFTAIGKSFGSKGKLNHVFDLFGQFESGQKDVIFSGDAIDIVPEAPTNIDKNLYNSLHCL